MGSSETESRLEVIQWFEKSTTRSSNSLEDGINILITGFGPFRDHVVNASWEAVKLLNPDGIPWPPNIPRNTPLHISFCQLEVAYKVVHQQVPGLWDKQKPHLTVHVGVSGIAKAITLEQYAHNCGYCSPDVRECIPDNNMCVTGGNDLLQSGLNMVEVVRKLNTVSAATGVHAELSHDPGRSLSINKDRSAFIHVPPLGKPWSAEEMAAAISLCISEFLRQLQDKQMLL